MTEDALLINYPPLTDIGEIRAPNRSAGLILWGGGSFIAFIRSRNISIQWATGVEAAGVPIPITTKRVFLSSKRPDRP